MYRIISSSSEGELVLVIGVPAEGLLWSGQSVLVLAGEVSGGSGGVGGERC